MRNPYSFDPVKPVVQTRFGSLRGARYGGVDMFLGVKYADAERFRMPKEQQPWDGVKNAYVQGPICPHLALPHPFPLYRGILLLQQEDENCLNLNIWTPADRGEEKKPVFVWLHGGGFTSGNAMEEYSFDGFHLAKDGDMVFVSVNHRLNILGYMNLSAYGEAFSESANLGIWDLVAALQWIHENIQAFGGDPENITICGHSGGGGKVLCLYQLPEAAAYFQRGIVLSGVLPASEWEDNRLCTQEMLGALGIGQANIEEVYTTPYRRLVWAYQEVARPLWDAGHCVTFAPRQSERFPGPPPYSDFAACSLHKPLIISTVMAEFASCPVGPEERAAMTQPEKLACLRARYGADTDDLVAYFRAAYPAHDILDIFYTDTAFRPPALDTAYLRSRQGAGDTYVLLSALNTLEDGCPPLWHGGDVGYAFRNTDRVFVLNDPEYGPVMTERLSQILIHFARCGDPNHAYLPPWKPFTEAEPWTMLVDKSCALRMAYSPETRENRPFDAAYLDLLTRCTAPWRTAPAQITDP